MKSAKHGAGAAMGVGIAACAACCAAPILAAVGGAAAFIGIATFVAGAVGLGVAALGTIVFALRWRRRQSAPLSVVVQAPSRRDKIDDREQRDSEPPSPLPERTR